MAILDPQENYNPKLGLQNIYRKLVEIIKNLNTAISNITTNTTDIAALETQAGSYKKYVANLTQTGTSAPTISVLENTLGGTLVWTYSAVGEYTATLAGLFPDADKVAIIPGLGGYLTGTYPAIDTNYTTISGYVDSADAIKLVTINNLTNAAENALLVKTTIEIRVYPS